jgi:hemerythrin superfamily protein
MADDVITMIKSDHQELERICGMLQQEKNSRPLMLPVAVALLTAHSRGEEDHVYPVLAREAGEKSEVEHSRHEHAEAEQDGQHLLGMDPQSSEFESALNEWISAVLHHAEEEENELLPALEKAVDISRLTKIGMEFAARRAQELTGQHAGKGSGRKASNGQAKTKEELLEQARKQGVKGRSSMSKAELEKAVGKSR